MSRAIFLSYGRKDQSRVRSLADVMRRLGHQVWLDAEISGGQRWWDTILEEVRRCNAFVFALSPESSSSDACQRELRWATALAKPILPVCIAGDLASNLPAELATLHVVDFRGANPHALPDLARALTSLPGAPAPAQPEPLAPDAPPMRPAQRARPHTPHYAIAGLLTATAAGGWMVYGRAPPEQQAIYPVTPVVLPPQPNKETEPPPKPPPPGPVGPGVEPKTKPARVASNTCPELVGIRDTLAPIVVEAAGRLRRAQLSTRVRCTAETPEYNGTFGTKLWYASATVEIVDEKGKVVASASRVERNAMGDTRREALRWLDDQDSDDLVRDISAKLRALSH